MTTPTQGEHAQTEALNADALDRIETALMMTIEPETAEVAIALLRAPAQPAAPQGVAYAELPDQVAWRDSTYHCDLYYQPTYREGLAPLFTADQLRDFADRTHALRASNGQAPAGAAPRDIERELEMTQQFNAGRQYEAERIAVRSTTAQAAPAAGAVAGPTVFGLQWPDDERINLSTIFDTEYEANKFILERCSTPGIRVVRLSEHPTPAAQADSVPEDAAPSVEATAKALAWLELPMHVRQTMRIRAEATLAAARKQGGAT